jgi:hypothetical protein
VGGREWREGEGEEKEYDMWDPQLVLVLSLRYRG